MIANNIKKTFATVAGGICLVLAGFTVAGESPSSGAKDAWLDGKLDTIVLLNEHLNPFDISTDVTNATAYITGTVDSEVKKDLLTELAKSVDGIEGVENQVMVAKPEKPLDEKVAQGVTDASITTAIATKLLLNTEINSTAIDVTTESNTVTLSGDVESHAERDLVGKIASNTFKVTSVNNDLTVMN